MWNMRAKRASIWKIYGRFGWSRRMEIGGKASWKSIRFHFQVEISIDFDPLCYWNFKVKVRKIMEIFITFVYVSVSIKISIEFRVSSGAPQNNFVSRTFLENLICAHFLLENWAGAGKTKRRINQSKCPLEFNLNKFQVAFRFKPSHANHEKWKTVNGAFTPREKATQKYFGR